MDGQKRHLLRGWGGDGRSVRRGRPCVRRRLRCRPPSPLPERPGRSDRGEFGVHHAAMSGAPERTRAGLGRRRIVARGAGAIGVRANRLRPHAGDQKVAAQGPRHEGIPVPRPRPGRRADCLLARQRAEIVKWHSARIGPHLSDVRTSGNMRFGWRRIRPPEMAIQSMLCLRWPNGPADEDRDRSAVGAERRQERRPDRGERRSSARPRLRMRCRTFSGGFSTRPRRRRAGRRLKALGLPLPSRFGTIGCHILDDGGSSSSGPM